MRYDVSDRAETERAFTASFYLRQITCARDIDCTPYTNSSHERQHLNLIIYAFTVPALHNLPSSRPPLSILRPPYLLLHDRPPRTRPANPTCAVMSDDVCPLPSSPQHPLLIISPLHPTSYPIPLPPFPPSPCTTPQNYPSPAPPTSSTNPQTNQLKLTPHPPPPNRAPPLASSCSSPAGATTRPCWRTCSSASAAPRATRRRKSPAC